MKKRLLQVIAFVCVTVMSFLLCSCGKNNDSGNNVDAENIRAEHREKCKGYRLCVCLLYTYRLVEFQS